MCGIAGALEAEISVEQWPCRLDGMARAIAHRGPDDQGTWFDAAAGVGLASRRLAIIDVSPEGHQPMCSASGRYVIVFNGEIYNFRDLRRELEQIGRPRFHGHSDTEVLLAAIEQWGITDAVKRTVGMFAFALWDRVEHTLSLGRDRLGEKPLYYGWSGSAFLFGSELKALRAHPGFANPIDRQALTLYTRFMCVPDPWSIYAGIRKLLPGSVLTLTPDDRRPGYLPEPVRYWSAVEAAERGIAEPFAGSEQEAVTALDDLLRDAVRRQMVADVPLGAFLSGGIDSSTIVALMQVQSDRPVKSFTIGFHEAHFNEAHDAAAVAAHLGLDHTELYLRPDDALAVIPSLPTIYDEPFADSSQIPTYLVARLAREQVTVSLSGDGGDELFGGYNRHQWITRVTKRIEHFPRPAQSVLAQGLLSLSPSQWDRLLRGLAPILPPGFRDRSPGDLIQKLGVIMRAESTAAMYQSLISFWESDVVFGACAPRAVATNDGAVSQFDDFRARMMLLDLINYLPNDILTKVDRASMAVSLESRAPMLDHRVVEFAWRLPMDLKIRNGQGKWALRQVLDRYVPRPLIDRPKSGFSVPIGDWLRGPLRPWADALLAENRIKVEGYFDPAPIRAKWTEHLSGRRNWQHHLWIVLMFEAWLDSHQEH